MRNIQLFLTLGVAGLVIYLFVKQQNNKVEAQPAPPSNNPSGGSDVSAPSQDVFTSVLNAVTGIIGNALKGAQVGPQTT